MVTKIDKKIKAYEVVKPATEAPVVEASPAAPVVSVIQMHEKIERPEVLIGSTYKIKTPTLDHALYVTINDIVLNADTESEQRRPFEIFINSKNMDQFQWVVALTRIMSAVFRKGGDCTFLVEEMKAVFDPHGGYFKPGGVFMPSVIAEIGAALERHLKSIGLLPDDTVSPEQRALIQEKRAEYEARQKTPVGPVDVAVAESSFPAGATLCPKCNMKATIIMDGCATCLNCGNSKCG